MIVVKLLELKIQEEAGERVEFKNNNMCVSVCVYIWPCRPYGKAIYIYGLGICQALFYILDVCFICLPTTM